MGGEGGGRWSVIAYMDSGGSCEKAYYIRIFPGLA